MLLTYTDTCTLIPPVRHFAPRDYTVMYWAANLGTAIPSSLYRALQWRHKRAKSFTIYDFTYTDYHGYPSNEPTLWFSCKVRYYSTAKEGMFKVPADFDDNLNHEFNLLAVLGL
jgi:hypothetical protein